MTHLDLAFTIVAYVFAAGGVFLLLFLVALGITSFIEYWRKM